MTLPARPPVVAVEPEVPLTDALGAVCRRKAVPSSRIVERDALIQFFRGMSARTLVLSAHNVFIFPPELTSDERLTIVNFHNSLLPRHRGRNAPSWALFERDPWVGISWHLVNAGIDEGDIVCQRRMRPTWDMTALSLTEALVDLGMQALTEILPDLLAGTLKSTPQDPDVAPSFHRSSDVPNAGYLEPNWHFAQASAFLRAFDFGKLPLFPQPRVRLGSEERMISGYRLTAETEPFWIDPEEHRAGDELDFSDADLKLAVALAPPARIPIAASGLPQGNP